jgi:nucleotide-binding universal stress UspA family protein
LQDEVQEADMSLFEAVLTPSDVSKGSEAAFELALAWSRPVGGNITLLNAAHMPTIFHESMLVWSHGESSNLTDVARRGAEDALSALVLTLAEADRERVESRSVFGAPADAIVQTAREEGTSLIVMGTHDHEGLSGVFGGSTTAKVVRRSPCPVIAVPPTARSKPPRTILAATDFSRASDASLREAAELAKTFDAALDVLHVYSAPSFVPPNTLVGAGADTLLTLSKLEERRATEDLNEFVSDLRKRGIQIRDGNVLFGSPARTLVEYAKRGQYDLLVMGTLGRSGVSHLIAGSVAERVVQHAPCPVLTVRHDYQPLRAAA